MVCSLLWLLVKLNVVVVEGYRRVLSKVDVGSLNSSTISLIRMPAKAPVVAVTHNFIR